MVVYDMDSMLTKLIVNNEKTHQKIKLFKKVKRYRLGVQYKFNVSLVIKNIEKATSTREGASVCVMSFYQSWGTFNVQEWYGCTHDETPQ